MRVMQPYEFERIRKIFYKLKQYRVRYQQPIDLLFLKQEDWVPYEQGSYFGEKNTYYQLKGSFQVPNDWVGNPCVLQVYSSLSEWDNTTNPQIKIYLDDTYVQAIDVNHREVTLAEGYQQKAVKLKIDLFSGRSDKPFPLHINLLALDPVVNELWFDFYTLFDSWRAIRAFGGDEAFYQQVLGQVANVLDFRTPYSAAFYESLAKAKQLLASCYLPAHTPKQKVTAVGHTHIDLAWLWTAQQAIEKGERSFQTVLKLMEEYPDYTFFQSQPQLYLSMKTHYPELYAAIKEKVREGRWEVDGAMWVEADCNLTSGESLVRQILYGKRFMKEEFQVDSRVLWLPDVFGYSAALPQILRKTNTPYFMTTKLSWNQFNQIPFDSFYWQGIDGSRVLTHFITTISEGYSPRDYYTTYNGLLDPYTIKGSFERYQQKDQHDEILIAYGYGDGGGGPTKEMLEVQKRLQKTLPDMPTITGNHVGGFFDRLADSFKEKSGPVWYGELYFEYHRGTLTSIGKNKKANRQGEFFLQTIEKLYSICAINRYPQAELEQLWKQLLFNQFHDILPGSSIKEVYDQTDQEYQQLFDKGCKLIETLFPAVQAAEATSWHVFNQLGQERTGLVYLDDQTGIKEAYLTQRTYDDRLLVKIPAMAGLSCKTLTSVSAVPQSKQVAMRLEESFETVDFKVIFDEHFDIISLFDKRQQREIVPKGERLNQLVAYEDLPMDYDAWDIDIYYQKKPYPVKQVLSAEVVEQGEIRDTLKIKRQFEDSFITQWLHFYHGTGRIDFETAVDWHQHQLLLKALMPIDVNTLEATFDIQFGQVKRPVHQNTTWDQARFESCGQKWVDLSEGNYGVSILTDSKYGFNTDYQKIGLSLIKSPIDPYPEADQGFHEFTYSLYAHEGTWQDAQTMEEALALNVPVLTVPSVPQLSAEAFLAVDQKNVLLDTVKKAEDEEALIVRLYEYHNQTTACQLRCQKRIKKAVLTNLLEETVAELPVEPLDAQSITIHFQPFEIQTIMLYLED